jgi:hypothetical protein
VAAVLALVGPLRRAERQQAPELTTDPASPSAGEAAPPLLEATTAGPVADTPAAPAAAID